jgi:hypothetical protein
MCGVLRKALQRLYDHGFNAGIVNPARRPAARLVMQPVHPPLDKTPPPLAHRRPVEAKRGRHLFVLAAFRTGQHDPSPQSQRLRCLPAHRQRLQFGSLIIAQRQGRKSLDRHWKLHRYLPPSLAQRRESTANLRLRTCDSGH